MSEEWNQDPRNSNWTDANTVRRLTETEVNSSIQLIKKQVRDRGVPQSYPDEWLELRWIRPGQTSLIPLQCRRREKRKRRGFTSSQMLHAHTHTPLCHTQLSHNFVADFFHTQFYHTQLCHTKLFHTTSSQIPFTHNFVTQPFHTQFCNIHLFHTYNLLHTNLSHTTLSHTTLLHTQTCTLVIHNTVTHTALSPNLAGLHHLLSFLPFPSHIHICLLTIGRSWHVGLPGPLILGCWGKLGLGWKLWDVWSDGEEEKCQLPIII